MRRTARNRLLWMRLGALLLAAYPSVDPTRAGDRDRPSPPAGPGLIEETGVELFLLDVEAVDRTGKPLRGLEASDFTVRRNGRLWPVVSVDDFCSCDDTAGTGAKAADAQPAGSSVGLTSPPPAPDRSLFVLYFDFSQLRSDGRHDAIESARRWVREIKEVDDEAMIAAYVTSKGLLTLCDPTTDREGLMHVLAVAESDPVLMDHFAFALPIRVDECEQDPTTCLDSAGQEYEHGRRSLEAFQMFLERLGRRAGRKTVLYFHENGMMEPGRLYLQAGQPVQYALAEGVGAAAMASRAAVYPLLAGMRPLRARMERETIGLGATLAEATGGAYNRGASDFPRLAMSAGRGCRCRYVLGLDPIKERTRSVLAVSVVARGVRLPYLYRVRPVAAEDLWLQRASAVLDDPLSARDLTVGAALVPVRAGDRAWNVAVQVAIDARSFLVIPRGRQHEAGWEVGARLQRLDGHGTWDMLGTSVGTVGAAGTPDAAILHAREFAGLRPGRYHLSAFVRDRMANLFGGAVADLDLPDPRKGGLAGPVMLGDRPVRLVSTLPLFKDTPTTAAGAEARSARDSGPVPLGSQPIREGATLLFETWICPIPGEQDPVSISFLTRDDTPLFRPVTRQIVKEGPCIRRLDEVPTGSLDPGQYAYVLRPGFLHPAAAIEPVPFVIPARPAPPD